MDWWPFSPAPQWLQYVNNWLVYVTCPAFFIIFGTLTAPVGRRVVSVVLAVGYFGFLAFAVLKLGEFNFTTFGLVGVTASLVSAAGAVAEFYRREKPVEHEEDNIAAF
jgi:hypothetical protein